MPNIRDLNDTLPCENCGTRINAEIWREELGYCLPCSNKYFDHKPMDGGACEHPIVLETGYKFFSEYLRRWRVMVACVECQTEWDTDIE